MLPTKCIRPACRNMLAAGVPQSIAMKVSGHKTDSMFRRYAIVAESDLRTALRRTQEYLKTAEEKVVACGERVQTIPPGGDRKADTPVWDMAYWPLPGRTIFLALAWQGALGNAATNLETKQNRSE